MNSAPRNRMLGIVLVLAAGGAMLVSMTTEGKGLYDGRFPTLDTPREVLARFTEEYSAKRTEAGDFSLTPRMLVDWLQSPNVPALIDIREPWEFDDYTVSGAINIPAASLLTAEGLARIPRQDRLVLLDSQGNQAAEMLPFLRMNGINAFYVQGGLHAWFREIMIPSSLADIPRGDAEQTAELRKSWRGRFGGAVSGSAPAASAAAPPAPSAPGAAPAPPAPAAKSKPALKSGQGC